MTGILARQLTGVFFVLLVGCNSCSNPDSVSLFNGESFSGWEGDTATTWRIDNGSILGGSLTETVPHNSFLCTERPYADFVLKLKFKLQGEEGFINAGVQFRSERLDDPYYEMIGYQADIGPNYHGSLYDESRRKKVLAGVDTLTQKKLFKPDAWNDYEIRAQGNRIQLYFNGHRTVDYTDPDPEITQTGLIGLQIHGGGKALVFYKDIYIREL